MMKILENNKKSIIFDNLKDSFQDSAPKNFNDYIGQRELKERLSIHIKSSKIRKASLEHILLFGPPGLGKTTLATIIAREMDVNIKITSGPILQKGGDLVAILSNLKSGDILFIDEIHRMPINVEEILYSAMEQFKVDIIIGEGSVAKTVSLPLQNFTLVGATTKVGSLSAPLRSRFGIIEKFDWYSDKDLSEIIMQSAKFFKIELSSDAALNIAKRSRGTPRIAKKIMQRIRDFIFVNLDPSSKNITNEIIEKALSFFEIFENGLTTVDLKILDILLNRSNSMAIGLNAISSLIGEDEETIEEVYEPFLMQKGYIERTPRGRIISPLMHNKVSELLQKYLKLI